MRRIFIDEIRYGDADVLVGCGPIEKVKTGVITYLEEGKKKYLSLNEFAGFPVVYITDKDIYDILTSNNKSEIKDNFSYLEKHVLKEENVDINDYRTLFIHLSNNNDIDLVRLIKLLVYVVRCEDKDRSGVVDSVKNKFIDDVEIFISDVEQDYLADLSTIK